MGDRIRLDAEPLSVGRARRFASATLQAWGIDGTVVETCVLLVSELATNAVLHARTPFTVVIDRSRGVRVEVHDEDPRPPHTRDYGPEAASGRGLHLVESLATTSGTEVGPGGKSVWFELSWEEDA